MIWVFQISLNPTVVSSDAISITTTRYESGLARIGEPCSGSWPLPPGERPSNLIILFGRNTIFSRLVAPSLPPYLEMFKTIKEDIISFKIKGLDEFSKKLEKIENETKKLDGEPSVSFNDLFSQAFLSKHTRFKDVTEMLAESGFKVESQEDFDSIPEKELDAFVSKESKFKTMKEMAQAATADYVQRKLGL